MADGRRVGRKGVALQRVTQLAVRELPADRGARTRKGDETSADSHEGLDTQSSPGLLPNGRSPAAILLLMGLPDEECELEAGGLNSRTVNGESLPYRLQT